MFRTTIKIISTVLAAAAIAVPVASAGSGAVPKTVAGAWSQKVTKLPGLNGVWTMVIKKGGHVDFYTPDRLYRPGCIAKRTCTPDSSTTFTFTGGRLTIASAPPCGATKGTYAWKVTGRSLTLRVINDLSCAPRPVLMNAVWKRTRL
jgi:hypothetical protein